MLGSAIGPIDLAENQSLITIWLIADLTVATAGVILFSCQSTRLILEASERRRHR